MSTVKMSRAQMGERLLHVDEQSCLDREAAIDVLPDGVLLDIFKFYLDEGDDVVDAWHNLVHVCQRWRLVVFASPCRLNLRLLCTSRRSVKKLLDIWPALPIVITGDGTGPGDITNIDAAIEHSNRISEITFVVRSLLNTLLEKVASIKEPFPALTVLKLGTFNDGVPVLPDSFLDGSAPRLRKLILFGIPFPGLPKLLLSAHHLVRLFLFNIPDSGYISPEAMVTCLPSLTSLESFVLKFRSSRPHPHQANQRLSLSTRAVLPSLTSLSFNGVSGYLEDIMARIDIPLLNDVKIAFFYEPIFDTPQLRSSISRTEAFKAIHVACIGFSGYNVDVTLVPEGTYYGVLELKISCEPLDQQVSALTQVFNSSLPPFPNLEHLYICEGLFWPDLEDIVEDTQWLELFRLFITVKSLYLDKELALHVAPALRHLSGERVTEVLPALQNLFVEGPVYQGIAQFIAARQLLGHLVAVRDWDGKRPDKS